MGRKELQRWMRGKLQQHVARKADQVGEKSQSTVSNQANSAADAGDLGAERSEMTSQSVNLGPDIPTGIEKNLYGEKRFPRNCWSVQG
jgi:hypothetical protein